MTKRPTDRDNSSSGSFQKFDQNKPRPDLVPVDAIQEIWKVLAYGAAKYDDENWHKAPSIRRYFAACLRHLWAWYGGEDRDPESGLLHLAHSGTCVLFMISLMINKPECDDRPLDYRKKDDDERE